MNFDCRVGTKRLKSAFKHTDFVTGGERPDVLELKRAGSDSIVDHACFDRAATRNVVGTWCDAKRSTRISPSKRKEHASNGGVEERAVHAVAHLSERLSNRHARVTRACAIDQESVVVGARI